MFFVHLAARQEFDLCKPLSALNGGREGRAASQPEELSCSWCGGCTAPSLALVLPDPAGAGTPELLRKNGKEGRERLLLDLETEGGRTGEFKKKNVAFM